MDEFVRSILVGLLSCCIMFPFWLLMIKLIRKKQGIENYNPKFHELIQVIVPKGARQQLKAYALIKGYRNEGELISYLINEELKKDNDKMNKG